MTYSFLFDFTIVLAVAGLTSAIAQRFKVPLILCYLLSGLFIGPYIPLPLFVDHNRIEVLSEFGVILVMFCVGLEFQFRRLAQVLPLSGLAAFVQISFLMSCGYGVGRLVGWGHVESIFLGACIAVSSTMVVSKALGQDRRLQDIRGHVFGILVLQDIIAILLVAALTAVAAGVSLSAEDLLGNTLLRLGSVLLVMIGVGMAVVPRFIRMVKRLGNPETLIITSCGICFVLAVAAHHYGYSVALGAFVAGILVSESGHGEEIEHLLSSLRDVFAAVFFVAIGMTVDPFQAIEHLPLSLLLCVVVIGGHLISITLGSLLSGNGLSTSVRSALALGQIGEFAFIIAAVGVSGGAILGPLRPVVVTVAVITAFTTPLLLGRADAIVDFIDRTMPRRLRIMMSFYESWYEGFTSTIDTQTERSQLKRIAVVIVVDIAVMVLAVVMSGFFLEQADVFLESIGIPIAYHTTVVGVVLGVIVTPFMIGIMKNLVRLSNWIASSVFSSRSFDPETNVRRRNFEGTVSRLISAHALVLAGIPFFILLSSVFDNVVILMVFAGFLLIRAVLFWMRAADFERDVTSGTRSLINLFGEFTPKQRKQTTEIELEHLPGLPHVFNYVVDEGSKITGKSLADLNLRALTGATVISIVRDRKEVILPTGREFIEPGDILSMAGTKSARDKALRILKSNR